MIYKTLTRLLMCNALTYRHNNTNYVTIAENRVFDTAIDDIQNYDNKPLILINSVSSRLDTNDKSMDNFSVYIPEKITIELIIFGDWTGLGNYVNNDRYMSMLLNVFEQQFCDALFKLQNPQAQKLRDLLRIESIQSQSLMTEEVEKKAVIQKIEIDARFNAMYDTNVYNQNEESMIDLFEKYLDIYPVDMVEKLREIVAINDASRLQVLDTLIEKRPNTTPINIRNEWV